MKASNNRSKAYIPGHVHTQLHTFFKRNTGPLLNCFAAISQFVFYSPLSHRKRIQFNILENITNVHGMMKRTREQQQDQQRHALRLHSFRFDCTVENVLRIKFTSFCCCLLLTSVSLWQTHGEGSSCAAITSHNQITLIYYGLLPSLSRAKGSRRISSTCHVK